VNIFYLHKDPIVSAEMSCDKHVVKMILESAQLLCTCHRVQDGTEYYGKTANGRKIKRWKHPNPNLEPILYKAGWVKHPSTIWLFESAYNYMWLYKHMMALNDEYKKRYNHTKDHVAIQKLGQILSSPPKNALINKIATDPQPAMPDECKVPGDSIASYRKYYIMKKARFATWKNRVPPKWFSEGLIKHLGGTISNGV
tara:strand:+ start:40 stop:633 length:594 start_codon:yes stop_codon:yes gene_type:complete